MKSMVLLVVAVGCGLVAMVGVQQVLSNGEAKAKEDDQVPVLVATTAVEAGTALDDTNVAFRPMDREDVPEGAVLNPEDYLERAPRVPLYPGEVVLAAKLGAPGDFRASMEIPKGMRVATVSVNLTKTHSGLIKPGDFVDVQVTYQYRNPGAGLIKKTKTFLQNIEVFATDSVRSGESEGVEEVKAKNISLLVTPSDANVLMLAESAGNLHLVLRGQEDTAKSDVDDVDLQMLEELGSGNVARRDDGDTTNEDGDVRTFLGDVAEEAETPREKPEPQPEPEPTVLASAAPVAAPEVPEIWEMEIRAGSEVRIEEISLPPAPPTDDATGGVVSLFKRFLSGSRDGGANERGAAAPRVTPPSPDGNGTTRNRGSDATGGPGATEETQDSATDADAVPDPVDSSVLDAVEDLLGPDPAETLQPLSVN